MNYVGRRGICAPSRSQHSPEVIEQHPVSLQAQYLKSCFRQIALRAHDVPAPFRKKFTIFLIPAFLTAALPTLHTCTFPCKQVSLSSASDQEKLADETNLCRGILKYLELQDDLPFFFFNIVVALLLTVTSMFMFLFSASF